MPTVGSRSAQPSWGTQHGRGSGRLGKENNVEVVLPELSLGWVVLIMAGLGSAAELGDLAGSGW